MPIRRATRDDIPIMAQVLAASFAPDPLFLAMFPYKQQHPEDYIKALRDGLWTSWYDYQKVLMVSYETSSQQRCDIPDEHKALLPRSRKATVLEEKITGMAEWERSGKGWEQLYGIWGWWDPRLILKPLFSSFYTFRRKLFGNKAAAKSTPDDPDPLMLWNFIPKVIPYVRHFFEAPHRQIHWSLEILAVHPDHQGTGFGKELVQQGLEKAKTDPEGGLPVSVIAAHKKEGFYQKCGFKELVGWVSRTVGEDGSDNPLRRKGVGGGAILWTR